MIFENIPPPLPRGRLAGRYPSSVFMEQYGSYNELYAREGVHHRTDGTRSRFVIVQRADKLAGK